MVHTCKQCGEQFITNKSKSKYCSAECQHKALKKEPSTAICLYCGKEFNIGRECKGLYCSNKCRGQHQHEKTTERKERQRQLKRLTKALKRVAKKKERQTELVKVCSICGKEFVATHKAQIYCSNGCKNKAHNRGKDKRIYLNGKPDLSINLSRLFIRDNGICQICHRELTFECDSNSNDYPSIDHITPIAKGGKHEWCNVQLACRGCNSKKSDKI